MKKLLLYLSISVCLVAQAQVGVGTASPDASSILDVSSTSKGMLTPRMTTAQRDAIASPAMGLLVFDTTENSFYFYNGTAWASIASTSSVDDHTGWGDYVDTQYTSTDPFSVNTTKMTLPNNAGIIRDSQKPVDIATFYDASTQTITGRNGDAINLVIEFKAVPTSNQNTRITVSLDIGLPAAVGEIYQRDFVLSKGQNVEHFYLSSFNAYTLDTWEANGGLIKIVSTAPTDIYDIRYIVTRTHKAR